MSKQDRQGVRTAAELERKYNLGRLSGQSGDAGQASKLNQMLAQHMATVNVKLKDLPFRSFMDNVVVSDYIRVYRDRIDGAKQFPFVYAPGEANTVLDMNLADGWMLAINAGLFDAERKPLGIVIQNGVVIQNTPNGDCKPLTIDGEGNLSYVSADADAEELVAGGIVSAVCGWGPIIVDSAAVASEDYPSDNWSANMRRQIIGQFANGDYAIVTCEGTVEDAQAICEGLRFAYCFSGGETVIGQRRMTATGQVVPTYLVFNGMDSME